MTHSHAAPSKRRVILEDDIDGFTPAQLLLLQSPEVEVLGISAVSGNIWRDEVIAHSCRLLELAGQPHIPVHPGPVHPLLNSELATERWEALYGKLVWKGAWTKHWVDGDTVQSAPRYHAHDVVPDLPLGNPSVVRASDEPAALFMLRMVRQYPGEVSIVATGPLTNLALAQALDPAFATLARELVYMGGSLNPRQQRNSVSARQFAREFVNSPRREFNIRWDPEAASIVMRAPWRKITMVPVDPSTATELTPELLARMSAADTPSATHCVAAKPAFRCGTSWPPRCGCAPNWQRTPKRSTSTPTPRSTQAMATFCRGRRAISLDWANRRRRWCMRWMWKRSSSC